MAYKKIRIRPEGTNNYADILHPETTASQVIEEANKKFMTYAERTKLAGIEEGATRDQTASEILTLLKKVDGTGSGLDADTLDGLHASSFQQASTAIKMVTGTYTGDGTINRTITVGFQPKIVFTFPREKYAWDGTGYITLFVAGGYGSSSSNVKTGIFITSNGFKVGYSNDEGPNNNEDGEGYSWLAFA